MNQDLKDVILSACRVWPMEYTKTDTVGDAFGYKYSLQSKNVGILFETYTTPNLFIKLDVVRYMPNPKHPLYYDQHMIFHTNEVIPVNDITTDVNLSAKQQDLMDIANTLKTRRQDQERAQKKHNPKYVMTCDAILAAFDQEQDAQVYFLGSSKQNTK